MHLAPAEVLDFIRSALPAILAVIGKPRIMLGLTADANAYANERNATILVNPYWISSLASPFGGFGWTRREHRAFIVGLLGHEVGHILGAGAGHDGELRADRLAAFVLSQLSFDPRPFSLWLFKTNGGSTHPEGIERMRVAQDEWVLTRYFSAT